MTKNVPNVNQVNPGMKQMHCFRVSEGMRRYELWQDTGIFIADRRNAFIKDVFYPCPREPFPLPIREQRIRVLTAASQTGIGNVLAHNGSCRLQ